MPLKTVCLYPGVLWGLQIFGGWCVNTSYYSKRLHWIASSPNPSNKRFLHTLWFWSYDRELKKQKTKKNKNAKVSDGSYNRDTFISDLWSGGQSKNDEGYWRWWEGNNCIYGHSTKTFRNNFRGMRNRTPPTDEIHQKLWNRYLRVTSQLKYSSKSWLKGWGVDPPTHHSHRMRKTAKKTQGRLTFLQWIQKHSVFYLNIQGMVKVDNNPQATLLGTCKQPFHHSFTSVALLPALV